MKKEHIISILCAAVFLLSAGIAAIIIVKKKHKHIDTGELNYTEETDFIDE